jgi:putative transposase
MIVSRAFRVELNPTEEQKILMEQTFGCVRKVFNMGLERKKKFYEETKKSLSFFSLCKDLTKLKETEEFSYLNDVSVITLQQSLKNVDVAYKNFFRGLKKGKVGFPQFKCKGKSRDSFRLQNNGFHLNDNSIFLAKLGDVKLKELDYIPLNAVKYYSVAISKQAGRYFASVNCEVKMHDAPKPETAIGIDVGIKTLVVASNGQTFDNPKNTRKYAKKLRRQQRRLSRTKKGSQNRKKAIKRVQKIHYKISNCRKDNLHKITSNLVKTKPRYIVIEDLNVKGMLKNRKLSKSVADASFSEIKKQLEYKVKWYGGEIVKINRWFPSSKLCSVCGEIHKGLTLKDRIFVCPSCGHTQDRDEQASWNIETEGLSTLGQRGIYACGESNKRERRTSVFLSNGFRETRTSRIHSWENVSLMLFWIVLFAELF